LVLAKDKVTHCAETDKQKNEQTDI